MKIKALKPIAALIIMLAVSCDEPETVVTNYVHPDGSVSRKIEMRSSKKNFKVSDFQVPFDKTWTIKDSVEINAKGDTTWVKRAVKLFRNTDEINLSYKTDSGANKGISRHSTFTRKFRWFNTEYRFSETINGTMKFGYPVEDFLSKEELGYYYSPDRIKAGKQNSADSLKYRAFEDSISKKTDLWASKCLISEWIGEFSGLTEGKAGNDLSAPVLKSREDELLATMKIFEPKFDSLWENGTILRKLIGDENALKYRTEADTALSTVTKRLLLDFKEYSVRIAMPGQFIGTNGFIDSGKVLQWPVKSDFFLTRPYEMYAESKTTNVWAWIISGLFLLFVLTGVFVRLIKKG